MPYLRDVVVGVISLRYQDSGLTILMHGDIALPECDVIISMINFGVTPHVAAAGVFSIAVIMLLLDLGVLLVLLSVERT